MVLDHVAVVLPIPLVIGWGHVDLHRPGRFKSGGLCWLLPKQKLDRGTAPDRSR